MRLVILLKTNHIGVHMKLGKFSGSYKEIVSQFDSPEDMLTLAAKQPSKLVQLFAKAVKAHNTDAAVKVGERIKDLDNSLLNFDELIEITMIADQLQQQENISGKASPPLVETLERMVTKNLTIRKAFRCFHRSETRGFEDATAFPRKGDCTPAFAELML